MVSNRSKCAAATAVVLSVLTLAHGTCAAASYPNKSIRLIVPFSPGGGADIQARLVAQHLAVALGQPVVVDNRAGAGGMIGYDVAAKAEPNGYTIATGSVGLASIGAYAKLPFDPISDFAAISVISLGTNVLVLHPSVPATSVTELITLAKAAPGKLNYANAGAGSPMHLAGVLFNHLAKTNIVDVPYKGGGPALTAIHGQEIDLMFGALVATMPGLTSGKLRAIAVTTAKRSAVLPNIPTIAESGVAGYEFNAWTGLFAPDGTPTAIINRLNSEVVKILNRPDVRRHLAEAGPMSSTPAELQATLRKEVLQWRTLLSATKRAGQ